MTKFKRTLILAAAGMVAFFMLLGWAGDYDYCEQVILHMSQHDYDSVKHQLTILNGHEPSDREIAHCWIDSHK